MWYPDLTSEFNQGQLSEHRSNISCVKMEVQFDLWIINFDIKKNNFDVRLTKLNDISLNVEMYKM